MFDVLDTFSLVNKLLSSKLEKTQREEDPGLNNIDYNEEAKRRSHYRTEYLIDLS